MAASNRFALASAKDRAELTLANAYGEGVIDDSELEGRLERLADAEQLSVVEGLVADLEPVELPAETALAPAGAEQGLRTAPSTQALARLHDGEVDERRKTIAIMSEQKRAGDWIPARHNEVLSVMGSTTLDLREARLPPGEITIRARGFMSELVIIVPPGMRVLSECSAILSEVSQDERYAEAPPHPTRIRVTGLLVMSSVSIRERQSGESKRDARRRRRRERRALRQAERARKALGRGD